MMGKPVINDKVRRNSHELSDKELLNHKEDLYEFIEIIKILKEKNILPVITTIFTKKDTNDSSEIGKITNGIKKGLESSMASLNNGKELNTFQLMKLMKDPEINRAITFLLAFFKGMGKSL